jgi:hypothetical protein
MVQESAELPSANLSRVRLHYCGAMRPIRIGSKFLFIVFILDIFLATKNYKEKNFIIKHQENNKAENYKE